MKTRSQTGTITLKFPLPNTYQRRKSEKRNCQNSNAKRIETADEGSFQPVRPHVYILRGNSHQGDSLFCKESRNRQCTANACVAIAYLNVRPIHEWNSTDLDTMLSAGDLYYKQCREHQQSENIYLSPDELLPTFTIGGNSFRVNFKINVVDGLINPLNEDDIPEGYCGSLSSGVKKFFRSHSAGILTCETLISVSIFRVLEFYYLFDSHARGEKGHPAYKHGKATVMQFENRNELIRQLFVALQVRSTNYDLQYSITAVSGEIQQDIMSPSPAVSSEIQQDIPPPSSAVSSEVQQDIPPPSPALSSEVQQDIPPPSLFSVFRQNILLSPSPTASSSSDNVENLE